MRHTVMASLFRKMFYGDSRFSKIMTCKVGQHKVAIVVKRNCSTKSTTSGIWANEHVQKWLTAYEELVGLAEVKQAQDKVLQAEQKFLDVQVIRRKKQIQLAAIQSKLKELNAELDKVQRGEDRYLALLTQEHSIIREENGLLQEIANHEELERNYFSALSSAVRESHEKERSRTERTKYWSVTASVIGAILGICGTSVNNYLRMRELKGMVREQAKESVETKELVRKLTEGVTGQHDMIKMFVKDVKALTGKHNTATQAETELVTVNDEPGEKIDLILTKDKALLEDINEIKRLLSQTKVLDKEGNAVYLGSELEDALGKSESKLETKMKINALYTVTLVYAAFALTLPILHGIFKGS